MDRFLERLNPFLADLRQVCQLRLQSLNLLQVRRKVSRVFTETNI